MSTIPLPAILPDPHPTEADIKNVMSLHAEQWETSNISRVAAELIAKCQLVDNDNDALVMPVWSAKVAAKYGWSSYSEYRKSACWAALRNRVMKRANFVCECCGSWASEVHIRDYRPRVLSGNDLNAIIAVCAACHEYILVDPATGRDRETHEEQEAILQLGPVSL